MSSSPCGTGRGRRAYLHDEIATDRRNPTVNANGPLYGSPEESSNFVPILDPVRNTKSEVKVPVRDPSTPSSKNNPMAPSPYWGAGSDLGQSDQRAQPDVG